VLTLLAMVGLLTTLVQGRNRTQKLFFAGAGASSVLLVLSLQFSLDRYEFPLVLMALPWAAIGISTIGTVMAPLLARSDVATPRGRLVFAGIATVFIGLVAILSFRYVGGEGEFVQSTAYDLKSAGLWLKDRHPQTVMGMGGPAVSYYAGATEVYLPWAQEDTALRYIHAVRPDFIYLRHGDEHQAPYIEQWLAGGIPDRCAVPVQSFPQAGGGQLTIFDWQC
jgi:hypothetical protein